MADSVRADLPGFGGGPALTPILDGLAGSGAVFDEAIASAAWTVPSLVALTTGTYPHKVGVARWRHPFPRRRPTLMTAFAAAGFEVHTLVHNPRFGLANMGFRGVGGDSEDLDQVLGALRAPPGVDRLVFIHHWWTHLPYEQEFIPRRPWRARCSELIDAMAADPAEVQRQKDRYADALAWFDRELLPRYLDAAASGGDDVLFAFTGDHGENHGESLPEGQRLGHIYDMHGRWLDDGTTRVPWMLWGQGVEAVPTRRIGGLARGVDLAPTLAALAGVPWPGPLPDLDGPTLVDRGIRSVEDLALDGRSLLPSVLDGAPVLGDAMTISSYNAIHPAKYPEAARRLWCRYGLRTADSRYTWDRLHGVHDVRPLEGSEPSGLKRLVGTLDRKSVV